SLVLLLLPPLLLLAPPAELGEDRLTAPDEVVPGRLERLLAGLGYAADAHDPEPVVALELVEDADDAVAFMLRPSLLMVPGQLFVSFRLFVRGLEVAIRKRVVKRLALVSRLQE